MSTIPHESPTAYPKPPPYKFTPYPTSITRPDAPPETIARRIRRWFYLNVYLPWYIFTMPAYLVLSNPHPIHLAFTLLWPFPWKFPLPSPLPVQELLDNPNIILDRRDTEVNYVTLRKIERFCQRDSPLRSLYRLYETVVADNEDEMMQESQYWFHRQHNWKLADIPDPRDPDPIRYAILASLTDALVLSFNHKIKYGMRRGITDKNPLKIYEYRSDPDPPLESSPAWCVQVGPLSQRLELDPGNTVISDDLTVIPGPLTTDDFRPFAKRNIIANFVQLYNV